MSKAETIYNLAEILKCDARLNEPMSRHTSFKIGGNAAAYIKVGNLSKLSTILKECRVSETPYFLLGNGSNILVGDGGTDKVVIKLDGEFRDIRQLGDGTVFCGAGASLPYLCKFALRAGLSGLEFAWGIPGTVGGAVFMNAGAYGGEMKDSVISVSHITPDGEIGRLDGEDLGFGYRDSVYRKNGYIITGAVLKLKEGVPRDEIQSKMDEYMKCRADKQPIDYPSAGSVFKRPRGNYAAALIEQCGLKGKTVGGAQVSEKHCGFIINKSSAKAEDVKELIRIIKSEVKEKTGCELECEIVFL